IHEILNDAQPDSGKWSGAGAVKYSNLNKKLCDLVDAMQEVDAKIAGIVHRQANQVQQARVAVAGAAMGLVGVLLLTATLSGRTAASLQKDVPYFREKFGFAAAAGEGLPLLAGGDAGVHPGSTGKWFGLDGWVDIWLPYIVLPPCIAALAAALACFLDLIAQGSFNAGDMQDQIDAYSDAHRDAADILDGLASAVVTRPGAAQSTVSRYWENLVVADDADALMGVSKTVGIVNAPADNRVPVGVFAGDGVALGASALAMSVPEPQPPPLAGPTQAAPGQSSGAVNMLSEEVFAPAHRGGGVDRHVPPLALAAWRQAASATKPVTKKAASAEAVTGQAVSGPAAIMENGDDQQAAPGPRYPSGVPGEVVTVGAEQLLGPAWVNGRASSEGADLPSPVAHRGQIT
ncbi:MAG: hypothetical protein K2Q25_12845, partial [Mycobacteriaceae bacterium]|nr:hypothetical protein [Mycobacteriaceae bacterium]